MYFITVTMCFVTLEGGTRYIHKDKIKLEVEMVAPFPEPGESWKWTIGMRIWERGTRGLQLCCEVRYGRLHSDLESWSICSRISLSLKYLCQLLSGLGFRG